VFIRPSSANVVELRTQVIAAVAEVMPEMLCSMRREIDYIQSVEQKINPGAKEHEVGPLPTPADSEHYHPLIQHDKR
jgi:hypothetical protein